LIRIHMHNSFHYPFFVFVLTFAFVLNSPYPSDSADNMLFFSSDTKSERFKEFILKQRIHIYAPVEYFPMISVSENLSQLLTAIDGNLGFTHPDFIVFTSSKGIVDPLLDFKGYFQSVIANKSLLPQIYKWNTSTSKYEIQKTLTPNKQTVVIYDPSRLPFKYSSPGEDEGNPQNRLIAMNLVLLRGLVDINDQRDFISGRRERAILFKKVWKSWPREREMRGNFDNVIFTYSSASAPGTPFAHYYFPVISIPEEIIPIFDKKYPSWKVNHIGFSFYAMAQFPSSFLNVKYNKEIDLWKEIDVLDPVGGIYLVSLDNNEAKEPYTFFANKYILKSYIDDTDTFNRWEEE